MPNRISSDLLNDFLQHMKDNGTSEDYQKGRKPQGNHSFYRVPWSGDITSYNVNMHKQVNQVLLDTKTKNDQIDADKK